MTVRKWLADVNRQPNAWVRIDRVVRARHGLDLEVSVARSRRVRSGSQWRVSCVEVQECQLGDLDGGGMQMSSSDHPAVRQYTDPKVGLRGQIEDVTAALGALFEAHTSAVDDWIPFDRYLGITPPSSTRPQRIAPRGPRFLMRAYAPGLRRAGITVDLDRSVTRRRGSSLRLLHFGDSFVVARTFRVRAL